ncbi:YlbG family protein [Paenibacillus gansuensis]|uniref:YlbG family protein n=1 Tax=Paenibacillus gansuensis TaxID=306542 RepID=A0ABW5PDA3_9BACL
MFKERAGLIVWISDLKAAKSLERYGSIHYISKKMSYVAMYVNAAGLEDTTKAIQKLSFVKKIERSYRTEIKTEYNSNVPDKTAFYSY